MWHILNSFRSLYILNRENEKPMSTNPFHVIKEQGVGKDILNFFWWVSEYKS